MPVLLIQHLANQTNLCISIMQICLLPNTQQDGWSALMAASRNGNLGAVEELLNAGAQPNLEDEVNKGNVT